MSYVKVCSLCRDLCYVGTEGEIAAKTEIVREIEIGNATATGIVVETIVGIATETIVGIATDQEGDCLR